MSKQILRTKYLERLQSVKDLTGTVKVITGVRRCGKTTLMEQFMDVLRAEGVPNGDIIYMNFEILDNDFPDYKQFHKVISKKLGSGRKYVFLDEVQNIPGWEKAVNSIRVEYDCDIYITGSNAFLLSSELATLLGGRTFDIYMMPLSFKEFLEQNPSDGTYSDLEKRYDQFVRLGAMPMINTRMDQTIVRETLLGLISRIIVNDIAPRSKIRDISTLNKILRFMMSNIGNATSPASIAQELGLSNPKLVSSYLSLLEQAYILCRAQRYDISGKKLLKTNEKYYCIDPGMRAAAIGYERKDVGRVLENIVYLELVRRGYDVTTGEVNGKEVDFVAVKGSDTRHYQVTLTLAGTSEREFGSLKSIRDNYPKTVITADRNISDGEDGIKEQNYLDFLLEEW
ncbi:MAG: ATP-binding protein [Candidatus Methanoplasma sp.]|jgi:predicted AAA+ superfamily ATPase|nr:ATP-binding protein [Candidatus Methanoplasma sp.]